MKRHSCALRIVALFVAVMGLGCPDDSKPRLYQTYDLPPSGLVTSVPPSLLDQVDEGLPRIEVTEQDIANLMFLGPSLMEDASGNFRGINFSVYSQRAEKVRLLLFDDPESSRPTQELEMARLPGSDVWNLFVEGVGIGQHYGYVAWGPNWTFDETWYPGANAGFHMDVDSEGNRFNPNKLLFDPYCKAFNRDHDWSKGSAGTGANRRSLTYGAAMKCVVVGSKYSWSEEETAWREKRRSEDGARWDQLIIYEVHPKGFTANSASAVDHPGTFRGFGEKADYLQQLGVTAVELLPPYEKALDAGYWGYNTLSYFAPELSYSYRKERESVIDEFKWMVDELHKRGIEVIVDVVYNHTGEGGLWREKIYPPGGGAWSLDPEETASLFSYRGLDNFNYYVLSATGRQYANYTGVGNTTRCDSAPMRRLIVDSLRYWVDELHVDGFRFDLAPVLGMRYDDEGGAKWDPETTVLRDIIEDPVLQKNNTRIIAEPWGGDFKLGGFLASNSKPGFAWAEWNGHFRDWWRSFVNQRGDGEEQEKWNPEIDCRADNGICGKQYWPYGGGWCCLSHDDGGCGVPGDNYGYCMRGKGNTRAGDPKFNSNVGGVDGGKAITGSDVHFQWNGRKPYHSINFITVHDGMTMYDLVSYERKVNDCGPLNPICCTAPYSPYCDEAKKSGENNNRSRDWGLGQEDLKRQVMRNFFVAMMVSHGTPLIFGGDEWLRTQLGNNNTYTPEADNSYSWHDWGAWQSHDERWRMFDFVSKLNRFRKEHSALLAPSEYGTFKDEYWRNPDGSQASSAWSNRALMIHYSDRSRGPELAILFNMEAGDVTFNLPAGRQWRRLLDTQSAFDAAGYLNERQLSLRTSGNITLDAPETMPATYTAKSNTIVVMEAQ